jgi:hypothetical protein
MRFIVMRSKLAQRRRGVGDFGEGVEIAEVAYERDVAIAEEPRNALAHGPMA